MKTIRSKRNNISPFSRRRMNFQYDGKEIQLRELSAVDFLASIERLFLNDTAGFFDYLSLTPEERVIAGSSKKLFKKLIKDFLIIHNEDTEGEKKKKAERVTIEESIRLSIKIMKIFSEVYHSHPEEIGKLYSLRQMILWLKEEGETEQNNQSQKQSRGDGKIPYSVIPHNARNIEWHVDGAGNRCRSYEVEI